MRVFLTADVLLLLALLLTNPTTDEYVDWAVRKEQTGQHDLGDTLIRVVGGAVILESTTSENFGLFTLFKTTLDQNSPTVALGALHHFVAVPFSPPWIPGSRYSTSPHVIATQARGQWVPEDGYTWLVVPPAGDMRVKWTPGVSAHSWTHIVAAPSEGQWYPEDGYSWVIYPPVPGDVRVRWTPGLRSKLHDHVVAAPQEQRWLPEQGFTWVSDPPVSGDFRVRETLQASRPGVPRLETSDHLSTNRIKAGCSLSSGQLFCPGPGTGMCWAKGHDPYRDEPPEAVDVGNQGSPNYGHSERCSQGREPDALSPERALLFRTQ